MRLLAFLVLALPVVEITGFIIVGGEIGVLATLALIFVTSALGIVLLRIQGLGVFHRIRAETDRGRVPGREMVHGLMIMIAGVLLLLPGFVTDLAGLLLFIPPIRDLGWKLLRSRIVAGSGIEPRFRQARRGQTIDLEESEYDSPPRPDSPWQRD